MKNILKFWGKLSKNRNFKNIFFWLILGLFVLLLAYFKITNLETKNVFFSGKIRVVGIKNDNFGKTYILQNENLKFEAKSSSSLNIGEQFLINGEIETFKLGQNSFENYLISNGVLGRAKKIEIQEKLDCDLFCKILQLKNKINYQISSTFSHHACLNYFKPSDLGVNCSDVAVFAKGLLIGDVQQMSKISKENVKYFGLTHLIAVSGFQVACLAAALDFFSKRFGFSPPFRFLFLSFLLIFFLILTDSQPPILRATTSFLLIQFFALTYRKMSPLRALFFAGFFILLFNPFLIISLSFWLSITATLGVIFASKIIDLKNIQNPVFELILTCFLAYIFTLGIILSLNDFTNPLSILLNIFITPAIPFISAILLFSLIPFLGQFIFIPASFFLSFILGFLEDLKSINAGFNLKIGTKFAFLDIIFYYLILFLSLFIIWQKLKLLTKDKNPSLIVDKPRWWNW